MIVRLTLCAVTSAFVFSSLAHAADLGGECCTDLEERIAELEATTARKGNRTVSLTVSGYVNQAVMFFDVDGQPNETNVYVGTNAQDTSVVTFDGSADINTDWSAGFLMEFEIASNNLASASQNDSLTNEGVGISKEALYIRSKTYGTIWLGTYDDSLDGITEISLAGGMGSGPDFSNETAAFVTSDGTTTFTDVGSSIGEAVGDGDTRQVVRYISPTFAGFVLSATGGDDDWWDGSLRYEGKFGSFKFAAGFGYGQNTTDTDGTNEKLGTSASVMHSPTGLYITGAYGQDIIGDAVDDPDRGGNNDTDTMWLVHAGIEREFFKIGATNIWGQYNTNDRDVGQASNLDMYGFGVSQNIDAAAMELYLYYKHFDAKITDQDVGDLNVVMAGGMIKF
ncbi:MAG: porin [Pseudomonadota bacterium]